MDDIVELTVRKSFKDGNFQEQLRVCGYATVLMPGKVYKLPRALAQALEQSGAEFQIPAVGMKELKFIQPPPPTIPTDAEKESLASDRQANEPKIKIMFTGKWVDGNLESEFAAENHPPTFYANEIITLPVSLFEKLVSQGAPITQSLSEMEQQERYQGKHKVRVDAWEAERVRAVAEAAASAEAARHNEKVQAKIEKLSALYLRATGDKSKLALQMQIESLYGELR